MAQRSRVRGDKGFRKILRQLPDAARDEMADVMAGIGVDMARAMQADAPFRTGALRAGISFKLARRSLRLRVGLVGTPRARAKLFYGWIIELGRKAQTVTVKRGPHAGSQMRIKAMPARPFVFKRRPDLRRDLNRRLTSYWDNVLSAAANGASFDE